MTLRKLKEVVEGIRKAEKEGILSHGSAEHLIRMLYDQQADVVPKKNPKILYTKSNTKLEVIEKRSNSLRIRLRYANGKVIFTRDSSGKLGDNGDVFANLYYKGKDLHGAIVQYLNSHRVK